MLRSLEYYKNLSSSNIFDYEVSIDNINPLVIDYDKQHQLLKVMDERNIIKILSVRKEDTWMSEVFADTGDIAESMKRIIYTIDITETKFPISKVSKTIQLGLFFDNITNSLSFIINADKKHPIVIARLNEGSGPHKIIEAIFKQPEAKSIDRYDIFDGARPEEHNIAYEIQKSNIAFLEELGFFKVSKNEIRRKNEVYLNKDIFIEKYLPKISEKYRKDLQRYLEK